MNKYDFRNISIKKLAGIVKKALQENNIDAVLVGGACV